MPNFKTFLPGIQVYFLPTPIVARSQQKKKKYQENDAPTEEIKRKIVFSDLRNPPNNFTLLFGEVAELGTLTKKDEQ